MQPSLLSQRPSNAGPSKTMACGHRSISTFLTTWSGACISRQRRMVVSKTQAPRIRASLAEPFLAGIAGAVRRPRCSIVAVTHLLPDRLTFLPALGAIAPVVKILAIPYSLNQNVFAQLARNYPIT